MAKKSIVLMYISEVSGHHSASIAIEKALKNLSNENDILNINTFRYTNPISEKIANRIYTTIIKATPKIWDYVYDNPKVKKKLDVIKHTIHRMNSPKLKRLFDKVKPDAVVCCQAFPCGMVADYKKTFGSSVPLIAVLTDYVPHSYWIYDEVDYFITPSEEVSQRLVKKGVASNKVKALGIPFAPEFNQHHDKNDVIHKLKLDPGLKTILIMGGGQGFGPIKTIVKSIEKVKTGLQEIIVCGTNKKIYKSLKKKIKKYKKRIILFGYAHNVSELMSVADLIVTKPGGITVSEALAKKLPMLIIKPIPGQEINNTIYLVDKKAAIKIDKPKKINSVIEDLFLNPDKLKELSDSAASIAKPNSSMDIAKFILSLNG